MVSQLHFQHLFVFCFMLSQSQFSGICFLIYVKRNLKIKSQKSKTQIKNKICGKSIAERGGESEGENGGGKILLASPFDKGDANTPKEIEGNVMKYLTLTLPSSIEGEGVTINLGVTDSSSALPAGRGRQDDN
jgi:hypothetical protein